MNIAILVGRVGKDPEIRTLQNDNVVSNFTLATTENYKDNAGEWQEATEWHNVSKFSDLSYLKKGDLVEVSGSIRTRKHEDKYYTSINAKSVKRLSKSAEYSAEKSKEKDDDLPF